MKTTDRVFGWLLVVASLLHCWGSYEAYRSNPELLLWAGGTGLAGMIIGAVNILRANRPGDSSLAWLSTAGCLGWLGVAFGFGAVVGNMVDFRSLTHASITIVLTFFSARTALRRSTP